MPFLCAPPSHAARNQSLSGKWLRCSTVPAVTETWRSQAAHCTVSRSRPSSQARSWLIMSEALPQLAELDKTEKADTKPGAMGAGDARRRINAAWRTDILPFCQSALSDRYP